MTNIQQNHELSISADQFQQENKSERAQLSVMRYLVDGITASVDSILNDEIGQSLDIRPDYSKCFHEISRLWEWGFKKESILLITCVANDIWELHRADLMPYLRLQCEQFVGYYLPEYMCEPGDASSFLGQDIHIENVDPKPDGIHFEFCLKHRKHEDDPDKWVNAIVSTSHFIDYVRVERYDLATERVSEYTHAHKDSGTRVLDRIELIQDEFLRKVLPYYVKSGREVVIL